MSLDKLTDKQISGNIKRYREAGVTVGGPFPLADLLLEQRRRKPSPFPHVEVARKIVELAKAAPDGHTTYLELWNAFRPGEDWMGNASVRLVGQSLARVVEYCVRNRLPILSVLVVRTGSRRLDGKAVANIYNEAKELGVSVGLEPAKFIADETATALAFLVSDLPQDTIE